MGLLEKLEEMDLACGQMVLPPEYDEAFLGMEHGSMRLVYSKTKIIEIIARDEEDEEDYPAEVKALEFFDYNIGGAYVGEMTPIYVEDDMIDVLAPVRLPQCIQCDVETMALIGGRCTKCFTGKN
jgi:hypothetical protein